MIEDNPELDGIDGAHPAWWRGNDRGVEAVCALINEILDGKELTGTCSSPWEETRQRIAWLVKDAAESKRLHAQVLGERATALNKVYPLKKQVEQLTAECARLREALEAFNDMAAHYPMGYEFRIAHDGFRGRVIGYYVRLDGKRGVVGQFDTTKMVHVYGERWLGGPDGREENQRG